MNLKHVELEGAEDSRLLGTLFVPGHCAGCSRKSQSAVFLLPVDQELPWWARVGASLCPVPPVPDAASATCQATGHAYQGATRVM